MSESEEIKSSFIIQTATRNLNMAEHAKNDLEFLYIDEKTVELSNVIDPYDYLLAQYIECTNNDDIHTFVIQNLHLILNSLTKENKFVNEIQKIEVKYNKRVIIGMRAGGFYG